MAFELSEKPSILGRSPEEIEKYGEQGTAFLGKVVMSAGETPVLGRQVLCDIAQPHLILVCGKRGGGKCLSGDSLITLEDGSVIPIKELEKDERSVFSLNNDFKIVETDKTHFYKRQVNKLLKIKLRTGKEIKLTPEHPLLTVKGWKPAEKLSVGSRLATPRKISVFGKENIEEFRVKLLAYLIAEGHLGNRQVLFSNADEQIITEFFESIELFDKNLSISDHGEHSFSVVDKTHKRKIIHVTRTKGKFAKGIKFDNKTSIRKWMDKLNLYGKKAGNKFIPEIILKSSKEAIALFLNRYFSCDGTIYFDSNTESWRVSVSSKSKTLINQLQHLLLRFGITGIIRKKSCRTQNNVFENFELELRGENVLIFLKEIGFFGRKESLQLKALKEVSDLKRNPNIDTIPKAIWDNYRPKNWAEIGRKLNYSIPKGMRTSINYSPSREKLLQIALADEREDIALLAESDVYWDEIVDVEELYGKFTVYDLTVPEHHNFVANDIIVHNSYTMAVLLEEFARQPASIRKRISVIAIDTVGIFWSLKIASKNAWELEQWELKPEKTDVKVLVPKGKFDFYREKKLPVDGAFTLKTAELGITEWLALFELTWSDTEGVLLTRILEEVKEKLGSYYGLKEIIVAIKKDKDSDELARQALINRFKVAESWGLFEKEGTKIREIAAPGTITVIDVSAYRQAIGMQGTRDIIVGLLGKKLFEERMLYRKEEEMKLIEGKKRESEMPIVWMLIDEAHMFMPKDHHTIALDVLLEWVRVGRQPGLSLVLATQRPNKLHPDCISQCDLFISHRLTSQPDIKAVSALRPSYLHQDFDKYYQEMPRGKGFALLLDDQSEKMWLVKTRPRFSWDAGMTATAFTE